jgi:hypothetical protein
MVQGGIPLGEWSGSDATRELHKTIKDFSDASSRQTAKMDSANVGYCVPDRRDVDRFGCPNLPRAPTSRVNKLHGASDFVCGAQSHHACRGQPSHRFRLGLFWMPRILLPVFCALSNLATLGASMCTRQRERDGVLLYMRRQAGFGNCNDVTASDGPGQRNSGRRATACCANTGKRGTIQQTGAGAAERRISHHRPYNIGDRHIENDLLPWCEQHGMAPDWSRSDRRVEYGRALPCR